MQIKNSLDKETLIKIGKGAAIAGTGAAALVILGFIQDADFGNQILNALVGSLVPILVNAIKEYMAGESN